MGPHTQPKDAVGHMIGPLGFHWDWLRIACYSEFNTLISCTILYIVPLPFRLWHTPNHRHVTIF